VGTALKIKIVRLVGLLANRLSRNVSK